MSDMTRQARIVQSRSVALPSYGNIWRLAHWRWGVFLTAALMGWSAHAECKLAVSTSALNNFVRHPKLYLDRFPRGGVGLAYSIRTYASFDRSGLKAAQGLILVANPNQRRDIGVGMAAAVVACLPRDGEIAKQVADVVRRSGNQDVIEGYLSGAGDNSNVAQTPALDPSTRVRGSVSVTLDQNLDIATPTTPSLVPSLRHIN